MKSLNPQCNSQQGGGNEIFGYQRIEEPKSIALAPSKKERSLHCQISATMRTIIPLFFALSLQNSLAFQNVQLFSPQSFVSNSIQAQHVGEVVVESQQSSIDKSVEALLFAVKEVGQVGSIATEEEQAQIQLLTQELIENHPSPEPSPAKFKLKGEHTLLYSAAPGGSSGRLFGNVVGKVTQFFEDDEIFYNRVTIGPVRIALKARREIKNDTNIKVSFLETSVYLFGRRVVQKEIGGGGVWKCKFVGTIQDSYGNKKLLRIMETPSLFVIEQAL